MNLKSQNLLINETEEVCIMVSDKVHVY